MDRGHQVFQALAPLHRRDVLGDEVAGVVADDGRAQDAILAGRRQHLDEAAAFLVHQRAVEFGEGVSSDLHVDPARRRCLLVQAHARHFRIGERGPRDHRVVGLESLEGAEQRIHRGVPGFVRCGVGELVRADHVAAGVDGRDAGAEVVVDFHGSVFGNRDAHVFEAESIGVRTASDGHEDRVERYAHLRAGVANADQCPVLALGIDAHRPVAS